MRSRTSRGTGRSADPAPLQPQATPEPAETRRDAKAPAFVDGRPAAAAQRTLQAAVDQSARTRRTERTPGGPQRPWAGSRAALQRAPTEAPGPGDAGPRIRVVADRIAMLVARARAGSAAGGEPPGVAELEERVERLREIADGTDEAEKKEVLAALLRELPGGQPPAPGEETPPPSAEAGPGGEGAVQAEGGPVQAAGGPVQRLGGWAIGGIVLGVGALVWGVYSYLEAQRREAIFTEFGDRHRRRDFDPDVVGEEEGGIHVPDEEGARPEDAPAENYFRVRFHKLHSIKLYLQQKQPTLYDRLVPDFGIDPTTLLLDIAKAVKDRSKAYKKAVKDMATDDTVAALQDGYRAAVHALGDQALALAERLTDILNEETDDDSDLEEIHGQGTDIWRETWHRAILAVNTVLHGRWPYWKGRLQAWTAEQREGDEEAPGLNYMDPDLILGLDYIGSLARGYKGPPKQAVRFMPEKFDVDANLMAPPLAAYALHVGGARVDRGRIWSAHAGIPLITDMEGDIQEHLEAAGLVEIGMDEGEPCEIVIDAEGLDQLPPGPGRTAATHRSALAERDQGLRDRIFWTRHDDMEKFAAIATALSEADLAVEDGGHLTLRDHPEEDQSYAYSVAELDQIEVILEAHDA